MRPTLSRSLPGSPTLPRLRVRRWLVLARRAVRSSDAALGQTWLVIGVLALASLVLFAVAEHRAQKAVVLEAETGRFLEEFRSEPVSSSWRRLSEVWEAERPRQQALLERAAERSGGDPLATLRPWREFMLQTIEEAGLQRDIEVILAFFRRLALCVRMGNCDPVLLSERLGDLPWRFRNQHHPYLVEAHPGEDFDRYFEIVAPPALITADVR